MDDELHQSGTDADADDARAAAAAPGHRVPRWVKVSVIVAGVAVVALIVGMLLSGGQHGPGQHLPGGGSPSGEVSQHGGHG